MSLNLYRISTTLINHPDYGARLKNKSDEIFSFFSFNRGDEEQIKRIDFIAGKGYTLEKIEKTDYINSTPYLLFSKRFVEKVGDALCEDMQFFSCNLSCQGVDLDWYAARIMRRLPIIDKEKTTFSTLTDEVTKVVSIPKYRKDIEEPFGVARDEEYIAYWVVSELFMNLCKNNGLQLLFNEV